MIQPLDGRGVPPQAAVLCSFTKREANALMVASLISSVRQFID